MTRRSIGQHLKLICLWVAALVRVTLVKRRFAGDRRSTTGPGIPEEKLSENSEPGVLSTEELMRDVRKRMSKEVAVRGVTLIVGGIFVAFAIGAIIVTLRSRRDTNVVDATDTPSTGGNLWSAMKGYIDPPTAWSATIVLLGFLGTIAIGLILNNRDASNPIDRVVRSRLHDGLGGAVRMVAAALVVLSVFAWTGVGTTTDAGMVVVMNVLALFGVWVSSHVVGIDVSNSDRRTTVSATQSALSSCDEQTDQLSLWIKVCDENRMLDSRGTRTLRGYAPRLCVLYAFAFIAVAILDYTVSHITNDATFSVFSNVALAIRRAALLVVVALVLAITKVSRWVTFRGDADYVLKRWGALGLRTVTALMIFLLITTPLENGDYSTGLVLVISLLSLWLLISLTLQIGRTNLPSWLAWMAIPVWAFAICALRRSRVDVEKRQLLAEAELSVVPDVA